MNCPHCNASVKDQVVFCPNCGQKITDAPTASAPVQQPVNTSQTQPERKWKGFFVSSIILLVFGAISVWIPIFGVILCVLSLVFAIISKKRKMSRAGGIKACIIISAILTGIALLLSIIILAASGSSISTTKNPTEKFVIEQLGKRFEFYDRYEKADLTVTEDENDQTTFYVKGQIRFSEYHEPSSYSAEKWNCKVVVDCTVKYDQGNDSRKMIRDNSEAYVISTDSVSLAITKINTTKAFDVAKNEYLKNQILIKDFKVNDYSVSASYLSDGSIEVIVTMNCSFVNVNGNMTKKVNVTLNYKNGKYSYISAY